MPKISAVIISFNEQDRIECCIKSLQSVVDDIVVLDSFSTDNTEVICKKLGVRFYQAHFKGYRDQKNDALALAKYDHVISLDADEALSDELCKSIQTVKMDWKFDAYYCNRLNNYCGQWVHHSNWYPDRKIRLFDRRKGKWGGYNLHETVQMDSGSKISSLKGDLLHWVHNTYDEHIDKANKFSTIGAIEYYKNGRRANAFSPFVHMTSTFIKSFFLRRGYKDGFNGFVICSICAYTTFFKYVKLHRLILNEKNKLKNKRKGKEIRIAQ